MLAAYLSLSMVRSSENGLCWEKSTTYFLSQQLLHKDNSFQFIIIIIIIIINIIKIYIIMRHIFEFSSLFAGNLQGETIITT